MSSKKGQQGKTYIEGAGIVVDQQITDTIIDNYMPYTMSVIISRAIPEIDGFKPSHRKILYTMYKMGLLKGSRTKSANIVGQVMKLNPHGDQAIYATMIRLSTGNETLLHPYVDSKGNFGKSYSREMDPAASRYTEAKLAEISQELFFDIEKNSVDFEPNYDNTMMEPKLLPSRYPAILVNSSMGIAVGMASSIPSFNLKEVCDTTIALMKDPEHSIEKTLKGPDFPGGGYYLYDKDEMMKVYETGRGKFTIRGKYNYDKKNNCIDITEISASTAAEAIIDKVVDLVKRDVLKGVSDIRDETDLSGLKVTIDLKKGADVDRVIARLIQSTPLEDNFSCNFNILIKNEPMVLGVREILNYWIAFRQECVINRLSFDQTENEKRLHLLKGLGKILLDLDKAIKIVRNTQSDKDVIPNLIKAFSIDKIQADYVAEIKLRNFNKEYILKRIKDIEDLEKAISDIKFILEKKSRINAVITKELKEISKKYGLPRKTEVVELKEVDIIEVEEEIPDYNVHLFMTEEGYFKKITLASWSAGSNHKFKDGDKVKTHVPDVTNTTQILFFTNKNNVYKSYAYEFENSRASEMGDFLPAILEMDEGEYPISMVVTHDFSGYALVFFENGKISKVRLDNFETKNNRRKLINAYSHASPAVSIFHAFDNEEYIMITNSDRGLIINTDEIDEKASRNTQGMRAMKIRKGKKVSMVLLFESNMVESTRKFRLSTIPTLGGIIKDGDLKFLNSISLWKD